MPGENVKDKLSPVDNAGVHNLLNIALLRGCEIVVKQQEVCRDGGRSPGNLFKLSAPDQGGGIGTIPTLKKLSRDFSSRACSQSAQLIQRFLCTELRNPGCFRERQRGGIACGLRGCCERAFRSFGSRARAILQPDKKGALLGDAIRRRLPVAV